MGREIERKFLVAEIELEAEEAELCRPPWLGREVSDDPRYFNSRLVEFPCSAWSSAEL
jgi:adenylate cyclase